MLPPSLSPSFSPLSPSLSLRLSLSLSVCLSLSLPLSLSPFLSPSLSLAPCSVVLLRRRGLLHVHPHPADPAHRLRSLLERDLGAQCRGGQQQGLVCRYGPPLSVSRGPQDGSEGQTPPRESFQGRTDVLVIELSHLLNQIPFSLPHCPASFVGFSAIGKQIKCRQSLDRFQVPVFGFVR